MKSLALDLHNYSNNLLKKDALKPKISIGIITHKRPHYLKETLAAIYPQLTNEVEVVVIMDGYDEESNDVLTNFRRVKYKVSQENMGRPKARNMLIREARGEYILWVDDDDIPAPNLISTYLNILKREPDIDVLFCNLEVFDSNTGKTLYVISPDDISGFGSEIHRNLIKGKGITFVGSLIRRSLLFKVGGFDERFLKAQDGELWFRLANVARFKKVYKKLYRYRKHSESISFQREQDYSYISFAIRNTLQKHYLEEIFTNLNWKDIKRALARALEHIALGLNHVGDPYYANRFAEYIDVNYISNEILEMRTNASLMAGDIKKAYALLSTVRGACSTHLGSIEYLERRAVAFEKLLFEFKKIESFTNEERIKKLVKLQVEHIPVSVDALLLKAKMYAKKGKISLTKESLRQAYRLNPKREDVIKFYLENCDTEFEREEFSNLQTRMYANKWNRPLYYLACCSHKCEELVDKTAETPLTFYEYNKSI